MGRCGRNYSGEFNNETNDCYGIVFSIHDFVYIYQRVHYNVKNVDKCNIKNNDNLLYKVISLE